MVEVIIQGSDGERDVEVKVDYLWDEQKNLRTYGIKVGRSKDVRVNAEELADAMKFCQEHQGD